jgi:putative inorganic carbon (hco3(-)) transporter
MKLCTKIIEYAFYSLFLFVPLIFMGNTSELFEFNKMWFTFAATTVIAAAWISKMLLQKKFQIQRTPLDIPILLFLLSQIISTLFSLDPHVSLWGYYSRFNGGLLSTICYTILYYAFVSTFSIKHTYTLLKITIIGGVLVALWGLPSHFGADPTCFVFRGTLDVTCWTDAFKPTVRAFSTLGQPAWLAAYLAVLIPLVMAFAIKSAPVSFAKTSTFWKYAIITVLFYLLLIFTNTRAGFIAFGIANLCFWAILFFKQYVTKKIFITYLLLFHSLFLLCNFLFGFPLNSLQKFSLSGIQAALTKPVSQPSTQKQEQQAPASALSDITITDSGDIRLYVWQGAIAAWKAHPLFGTGVETFAYAYYQFKPQGHNLTSEWDYLYNKAHNEYLNYLATTGIVGLGSYLLIIGTFFVLVGKKLFQFKTDTESVIKNKEARKIANDFVIDTQTNILILGLLTGWISILISNFFGFSVVIINLFFFLIPAFILIMNNTLNKKKLLQLPSTPSSLSSQINPYQWTGIIITIMIASLSLLNLSYYWYADVNYALGSNLSHAGAYQEAYQPLLTAVQTKPDEPVYKDELSLTTAVLATALAANNATASAQFTQNAIALNNEVVQQHPNNVTFWKNRVRLFYTLAQIQKEQSPLFYAEALRAIQKAHELAPTDAKISYNLGALYGQTGDIPKGIATLQDTIKLKPNYRDAYFALGLLYHEQAIDEKGRIKDPQAQQKAIESYEYILKNISPDDEQVKKALADWKK